MRCVQACGTCGETLRHACHCDLSGTVHEARFVCSTSRLDRKGVAHCWKERLGNPTQTPRQVLRTYVEELDITVASLDDAMDWDLWDDDGFDDDGQDE